MKTDLYTKTMLTLIALGLFLNVAVSLMPRVRAAENDVRVINYETDLRGGETLYVYCKNCR